MEADFMGVKYRFYIYEKPSAMMAVELRNACKSSRGTDRRSWSRCSLEWLHDHVAMPAIANSDWDTFTGLDQWDDYAKAIEDVASTGFRTDANGERYAVRCVTGDHTGFQDYNWTWRETSDGHCKRGQNPTVADIS